MGDSKERRVRWKGRHACETALSDPMSAIYSAIKAWTPPSGMFADSAVLLQVNSEQAQLLNRACFGRPYPPAIAPPPPSAPTYPPPIPGFDDSDSKEGLQFFQLALEEAFYLNYEMKCVRIYHQSHKEERVLLSHDELWRLMLKKKQHFVQHYKAYSHMRSKRWVVLSGIQFGADFMAYRHHPALVHSDYAVLVMLGEERQSRLNTWTELHAMGRLCGSVAKTLLLIYVKRKDAAVDSTFPSCLEDFDLETVEVNRWLPEKNREAGETLEENSELG
ncbi:tRNA-splicing endonuclease subunit Sen2 [Marchantia polymorpha subsp. ruderalis]